MNRISLILLLLAIVASSTFTAKGQAPAENRKTFLSALKEGQAVILRDVSGRFEISTIDDGGPDVLGYKVREIGADHIVLQDITGITEIHIPVYSVKAITRLKLPRK